MTEETPAYDKQAFDTFRDEHPDWHERSPFDIAQTFWQAGEQHLQSRIDAVVSQHYPTEVHDPVDDESITICAACQEITGGDACTTVQLLLGDNSAERVQALLEALPETSERGFRYTEIPFRDYRNSPERHLSIQESSLATEHRLWVGFDNLHVDLNGDGNTTLMERGHLDESTVRKLRDALTAWLEA